MIFKIDYVYCLFSSSQEKRLRESEKVREKSIRKGGGAGKWINRPGNLFLEGRDTIVISD